MKTIKDSFVGFVVLSLLIIGLATLLPHSISGQGGSQNAPPHRTLRKYYATQAFHIGSEALSACATGYHMASIWEILDVSNLKYDTELGFTRDDVGSGPPTLGIGWVRTGQDASSGDTPGTANCLAYTSNSPTHSGTKAWLPQDWSTSPTLDVTRFDAWNAFASPCDQPAHVWCVQD
jgi:hypothetical protein